MMAYSFWQQFIQYVFVLKVRCQIGSIVAIPTSIIWLLNCSSVVVCALQHKMGKWAWNRVIERDGNTMRGWSEWRSHKAKKGALWIWHISGKTNKCRLNAHISRKSSNFNAMNTTDSAATLSLSLSLSVTLSTYLFAWDVWCRCYYCCCCFCRSNILQNMIPNNFGWHDVRIL